MANEKSCFDGKVVLVQPIEMGLTDLVNSQDGLYTLYLRGSEQGEKVDNRRLISCVSRCFSSSICIFSSISLYILTISGRIEGRVCGWRSRAAPG